MDLKNATISFAVVVDDNEVTYAAIYFDHCVLLLLGYGSTQWKRNAHTIAVANTKQELIRR